MRPGCRCRVKSVNFDTFNLLATTDMTRRLDAPRPLRARRRSAALGGLELWSPAQFIAKNPVFTLDELRAAYRKMGRNPKVARDALNYHLAQSRLFAVRRGLYAQSGFWDPWALAARAAPDAVIAYDGALSFHGLGPAVFSVHFISSRRIAFVHGDVVHTSVSPPKGHTRGWEDAESRSGLPIRVTTLPQTLVDCLDRLDLSPPLDELWSAFKAVTELDTVELLQALDNREGGALLASRLGLFLSGNPRTSEEVLLELQKRSLRAPAYFQRAERTKHDQIVNRWNLIVPAPLFKLSRG